MPPKKTSSGLGAAL
jgi:hypothetical protein